jgi:hypothetical protein
MLNTFYLVFKKGETASMPTIVPVIAPKLRHYFGTARLAQPL